MSSSNQAQTKAEIQAKRDEFMDLLNEYIMQEVSYTLADGAQATEAKKHFDWKRRKAHKAILEFVFPAKEETETEATPAYESLKAENAKLEAMLDAVGAGGVGQSIKPQIQADTAPAAWAICSDDGTAIRLWSRCKSSAQDAADKFGLPLVPLYAAPNPARQPLTDEQIIAIADNARAAESGDAGYILPIAFARAIEAAHGITGGQQ